MPNHFNQLVTLSLRRYRLVKPSLCVDTQPVTAHQETAEETSRQWFTAHRRVSGAGALYVDVQVCFVADAGIANFAKRLPDTHSLA